MKQFDTIDDLLSRMREELGEEFRAALYTDGGGKGPYVMIMRSPDAKYQTVWAEGRGSTLNEALDMAIDNAFWKMTKFTDQ